MAKSNLSSRRPTLMVTMLVIVAWFVAAVIAGLNGALDQVDKPPLLVGAFVVVPLMGFIAAYFVSRRFRTMLLSLDIALLTKLHLSRIVGMSFFFEYLLGRFPGAWALPAAFGDLAIVLTAIPMAQAIVRRKRFVKRWFVMWNIFGLADFATALVVGVLYSNSPAGILATTVTTEPLGHFAISLIPTFVVPFCILLHILLLSRLSEVREA